MANGKSLDWKRMAEIRGIELSDTGAERLGALEQQMRLMGAMVDWKEDPILSFRIEEEESSK
jgi:hypothetical protein